MLNVVGKFMTVCFCLITTGEALWCYKCDGINESSCSKNQITELCNHKLERCVNVSFSYIENSKQKTGFKRTCGFVQAHWNGCAFNCFVPRQFNSTDCKASCCESDFCNTSHAVPLTGTAVPLRGTLFLPFILLIVSLIWSNCDHCT